MEGNIKKVCVTGGAGFIGSYVVRKLIASGLEVIVIDNLSVGTAENVPPPAVLVEADIRDPALAETIHRCDAVIHLAARVAIRSSFEFVVDDTQVNVVGTANMLQCATGSKSRVRKFVIASSMAVYSDAGESVAVGEQHPVMPVSPYGVSKLAAERLVQQLCGNAGIDSAVLRLFNTYGSGQVLSPYVGVVTIFANAMRDGQTPMIYGDGNQRRDFVHVQDVANAFVNALGTRTNGEVLNIGSGRGLTVREVYDRVAKILEFDRPPRYVDAAPGELRNSVANIAKAGDLIGYRSEHNFADSIADILTRI